MIRMRLLKKLIYGFLGLALVANALFSFGKPAIAAEASLTFSPNHGDYIVGNTFEISLLLNTNGESVNTIEANMAFPPDNIQVVSISKSLIEIWVAQPSFSNSAGTINLVGGIPTPGINTTAGIVTTITFRAKAAGETKIRLDPSSKVLKNDGSGTSILTSRGEALINITPAPPGGPNVSSKTHDDQTKWYNNSLVTFNWDRPDKATDFSYILDNSPLTIPDETVDSAETSVSLKAEADGLWYFHIRGRSNVWGGTTHYLVRIDNGPPAKFTPNLRPNSIDTYGQSILTFRTTDGVSDINHYEVKLISSNENDGKTTIFTEQTSPHVLQGLQKSKYKVVVRAFDNAGNYTDGEADLRVTALLFGLSLGQITQFISGLLILAILALLYLWRRHHRHYVTTKQLTNDLSNVRLQMKQKWEELRALKQVEKESVETIADLASPPTDIDTPALPADQNLPQSPDSRQSPPTQQL